MDRDVLVEKRLVQFEVLKQAAAKHRKLVGKYCEVKHSLYFLYTSYRDKKVKLKGQIRMHLWELWLKVKKVKAMYSASWETHLRAAGRHLHGITLAWDHLPPDTSERAPP